MVDNKEPPSKGPEDKQEEKQYTPYVSHRLRAKMESDDDEEKAGPGAAIAVTGLVVVIVGCGIWFLLGQKHEKKPPAGQTAETSQAANAGATDSAAAADSIARLAVADSIARSKSQQISANKPQPMKPAAAASKSAAAKGAARGAAASPQPAAAAGPLAGGAPANGGAATATAAPTKYGIAVGSFLFDDKAASEKDRLAAATSLEGTVVPQSEGGTTTYEVVLGSFDSRAAAEAKGNELLTAGTVKESRVIKLKK